MADLYDFCAYRTKHLLEGNFRQVQRVHRNLVDFDNNFSMIGNFLEKIANTLRSADLYLQRHKRVCKKVQMRNEECQKALACYDIEELIKMRDKLSEATSRRA